MKRIVLIITASIILGLNPGFSQNTFESVNPDTLSFIIIKYQEVPGKIIKKNITKREDIKKLVAFLKETNFESYQPGDARPIANEYIFHFNLGGWHEKIYLFDHQAFIGKSIVNIDPKVIEELKILYKKL